MNSSNPIGGYFELELGVPGRHIRSDALLLNSARNCFEYVLRTHTVKRVYMPKYTCDVMFEPLKKLDIPFSFYSINEQLEINQEIELFEGDYIVYTNYFGLKDEYCIELERIYGEALILDASQALFFEPLIKGHTFYSPRKFVGLPDGGCLYTDKELEAELTQDRSYSRMSHLLRRIEEGAEAGYDEFKRNDASLENQDIKKMSKLTRRLMGCIDFDEVRRRRINNYEYLQQNLNSHNTFLPAKTPTSCFACPMYYPYFTEDPSLRKRLIDNKIFVPTYWPNVIDECLESEVEYKLAVQLIPLPIDQRYNQDDMSRIVECIYGS